MHFPVRLTVTSSGEYRRWRLLFNVESRDIRRARALVEFVPHRSIFKHPARAVRPVRPRASVTRDSGIQNEFQQIPLTTTHEHAERASRPFGDSIGSILVFVTSRRGISVANRGFAASRARVCRKLALGTPSVVETDGESAVLHCLFI